MLPLKYLDYTGSWKGFKVCYWLAGISHLALSQACFTSQGSRHWQSWQGKIRQQLFNRYTRSSAAQCCAEHCSAVPDTVRFLPCFSCVGEPRAIWSLSLLWLCNSKGDRISWRKKDCALCWSLQLDSTTLKVVQPHPPLGRQWRLWNSWEKCQWGRLC